VTSYLEKLSLIRSEKYQAGGAQKGEGEIIGSRKVVQTVEEFAHLSLLLVTILVFQSVSTKYLMVNRDHLILRLVISVSVS